MIRILAWQSHSPWKTVLPPYGSVPYIALPKEKMMIWSLKNKVVIFHHLWTPCKLCYWTHSFFPPRWSGWTSFLWIITVYFFPLWSLFSAQLFSGLTLTVCSQAWLGIFFLHKRVKDDEQENLPPPLWWHCAFRKENVQLCRSLKYSWLLESRKKKVNFPWNGRPQQASCCKGYVWHLHPFKHLSPHIVAWRHSQGFFFFNFICFHFCA